jgi:hypothetical protein
MKKTKPFVRFVLPWVADSGGVKKEKESEVDCVEDGMEHR